MRRHFFGILAVVLLVISFTIYKANEPKVAWHPGVIQTSESSAQLPNVSTGPVPAAIEDPDDVADGKGKYIKLDDLEKFLNRWEKLLEKREQELNTRENDLDERELKLNSKEHSSNYKLRAAPPTTPAPTVTAARPVSAVPPASAETNDGQAVQDDEPRITSYTGPSAETFTQRWVEVLTFCGLLSGAIQLFLYLKGASGAATRKQVAIK